MPSTNNGPAVQQTTNVQAVTSAPAAGPLVSSWGNTSGVSLTKPDGTLAKYLQVSKSATLQTPVRTLYPLSNVATTTTTTTGSVAPAANPIIPVTSATGIVVGTILQATCTDGTTFRGMVTAVNTLNMTMNGTLASTIGSGATITIWGLVMGDATHTIASPLSWQTGNNSGSNPQFGDDPFTDVSGSFYKAVAGNTNPLYFFETNNDVTLTNGPTYGQTIVHKAFFHYGSAIEIVVRGTAGGLVSVKIDGQYINLTPYAITANGHIFYLYIPFGFAAERRIDVITYATNFGGVFTGQTDMIRPAPARGPKVVVMGASFTAGTGADNVLACYPRLLSDYLGWERLTASPLGGTGYIKQTSGVNAMYRLAHDIPTDTEVLIVGGDFIFNDADGVNPPAAIQSIITTFIQAAQAQCPNATIIINGLWTTKGVNGFQANGYEIACDNAAAAACAANGAKFVSLVQIPFPPGTVPLQGTLTSNVGVGGTSFSSTMPFLPRQVVQIDNERVEVLSSSGGGPYANSISGTFKAAHTSGTATTQVNASMWTGTGTSAAPSGYGTSDVFVFTDGIHPTQAGHNAIAFQIAQQIYGLF